MKSIYDKHERYAASTEGESIIEPGHSSCVYSVTSIQMGNEDCLKINFVLTATESTIDISKISRLSFVISETDFKSFIIKSNFDNSANLWNEFHNAGGESITSKSRFFNLANTGAIVFNKQEDIDKISHRVRQLLQDYKFPSKVQTQIRDLFGCNEQCVFPESNVKYLVFGYVCQKCEKVYIPKDIIKIIVCYFDYHSRRLPRSSYERPDYTEDFSCCPCSVL